MRSILFKNRQKIKAELLLAQQEWADLLRQSLQYKLGLGREGSLRTWSMLSQLVIQLDDIRRGVLGQLTDAKSIPGDFVTLLESVSGESHLRKLLSEVLRISKTSSHVRKKLLRIGLRVIQAMAHKDREAVMAAWNDLLRLLHSPDV